VTRIHDRLQPLEPSLARDTSTTLALAIGVSNQNWEPPTCALFAPVEQFDVSAVGTAIRIEGPRPLVEFGELAEQELGAG